MSSILFFCVSFFASIAGAICGIGGGVIIKPVLDMLGLASVATISFLSGCTVLSMSCYTVGKNIVAGDNRVDFRTGTPLAIGAAVGGVVGKQLFSTIAGMFPNPNTVGVVQSICLAIITIGTFVYTLFKARIQGKHITNPESCVIIGLVQGCAREIKVPKGMKERIILADGTKVWLNSGSCLTLSPGFGQTDRELQLEGEGMFEVAKDKHKPFIIRSGDIRVRVTGTVFNFKSYPEERFAKVTLVRGSLDVSSVTGRVPHTVTLKPCEQVVLDRNRDVMEKKVVETAPDVAWTCVGQRDEGISEDTAETEMTEHAGGAEALFFDEMSMEQIVQELERVFHVNIVVKKPGILQEKYYGDFRNRKDIFAILDVMLRGEQVSYQIKGDTVFIGE